jgi:membrane-bound lytic murein transglycosylase A
MLRASCRFLVFAGCLAAMSATAAPDFDLPGPGGAKLRQTGFAAIPGFAEDDHLASFRTFLASCQALVERLPALRPGLAADPALLTLCRAALARPPATQQSARHFFEAHFRAFEILPAPPAGPSVRENFVTGYYEPEIDGDLVKSEAFAAPILARPDDLVVLNETNRPAGLDRALTAARRLADGSLVPYPDRAAIEKGAIEAHAQPILWLRDKVEVFFVQVQGSAQVHLPDGRRLRLVYAGRNGQPYTSIGQELIHDGLMQIGDLSLAGVKGWLREHGLAEGEAGSELLRRNRSYIFFRLDSEPETHEGPIGGAGIALTPLRSIAIDRRYWPYGLPIWIDAKLPAHAGMPDPFRRLMIAQDTGAAILGAARADIFFGSGPRAGALAGHVRHAARFFVLLPRAQADNR